MLPWSGTLYCMDQSPEMVKILYQRFPEMQSRTWVGEMSAFPTRLKFDLVVNIQDSVNYYLKPDRITQHLDNVREQLTPHGAFLFDLSTEENIRNNFIDMDEIFETDTFGYERINTYLPRKRLNISRFYLWQGEDPKKQTYLEKHLQRMYTIDEIEQCLENSMFTDWVLYADETFEPATEKSERIHVIAMK